VSSGVARGVEPGDAVPPSVVAHCRRLADVLLNVYLDQDNKPDAGTSTAEQLA